MERKLKSVDVGLTAHYLGCNTPIPQELSRLIGECSADLLEIASPKVTYRIFPSDDSYILDRILLGNDINRLMKNCPRVLMFGATLGLSVDRHISRLQISDLARATVFDAAATVAIEEVCDSFCRDIQGEYGKTTRRFSPGYGDFPFSLQREFFALLDMQRTIGVTLTESGIMLPQKSVTAILGIYGIPKGDTHCE